MWLIFIENLIYSILFFAVKRAIHGDYLRRIMQTFAQ